MTGRNRDGVAAVAASRCLARPDECVSKAVLAWWLPNAITGHGP
jgi:hypothetical protein